MYGFPKHIATRADVDNLIKMFPTETKQWLTQQWNERFVNVVNPAAAFAVKTAGSQLSVPRGALPIARNEKTGEVRYVENCNYSPARLARNDQEPDMVYGIDTIESPDAIIFRLGFNRETLRAAPYNLDI